MKKNSRYAIHSDFDKFPVINFRFIRPVIGMINAALAFDCWRTQRQRLRAAPCHAINSAPGVSFNCFEFRPASTDAGSALPAVLYYHGGAYAMSYASSHVAAAQRYADEANCAVFLVDYRLVPAARYPAAIDDSYAALDWVMTNATNLGVDPDRVVVAGDSAGGGLAAAAAQRYLDDNGTQLAGQLLIYPTLDSRCSTPSATDFVDTPMWNAVSNRRMWQAYIGDAALTNPPPYASPAHREDLSGLPSTYMETAEFDPLVDEGKEYAARLQQAGVEVVINHTHGTVHGFDAVISSAIVQAAYVKRIDFLCQQFGN